MNIVARRLLNLAILSIGLAAAGCGGADSPEDDSVVSPLSNPRARCEMLVSAHCNRVAECGQTIQNFFRNAAQEQAFVDACEADLGSDLCSTAIGVSATFDQCLTALPRAACVINASAKSGFSPDIDVPSVCLDSVLMSRN